MFITFAPIAVTAEKVLPPISGRQRESLRSGFRTIEMQKGTQGAFLFVLLQEAELLGAQYRKTFFEAVNTTTYIQNFLLTSVERVAS